MSTNKVVLTYKRKRFSVYSDYGESGAPSSKLLKSTGKTNLDEEKNNDVGCSGEDSLSHRKQDFTPEGYSCTTVPDHGSEDLKRRPGSQLPDLNVTESPAPFDIDVPPETKCHSRFPEGLIATQLVSGESTCHESHPEARSAAVLNVSAEKVNVSRKDVTPLEKNVDIVRLEEPQGGNLDAPLITFTRRAKMKKDMAKTCIKGASLGTETKNIVDKLDKNDLGLNKEGAEGLIYRRREKSYPVNEKHMIPNGEEESNTRCLGELPHTGVRTLGNDLEKPATVSVENQNIDLQLSEHSELVECDKEENAVKLQLSCSSTSVLNVSGRDEVNRGKQHDIGHPLEENTGLGSALNAKDSHINLEQLVVTNAVQNLHSAATTSASAGVSQWPKLPREMLQLLQKEGRTCPSTREGYISNSQDQRFQMSDINQSKLDWHNSYGLAHRGNAYNATQFQERMFLPKFSDGRRETPHWLPERSAIFTNFLGPSASHADTTSSSVTNLGSMPKPLGVISKDGPDYGSRFLFGTLTPTTKTQSVDNILFGTRMLSQRQQGLSLGIRRHLSNWSDEELDSLWIGVRRHGRNSWNAMLRDPRLYFQDGRTAKDLVERWDTEQSRLFGNVQLPSLSSNKPGDTSVENFPFECPASRAETQLSLGNAYLQKLENHANRSLFQIPATRASSLTIGSSLYLTDDYLKNSIWKKPNMRSQKQIPVQRPSILERNTTGRSAVLPHWLKDAVGAPPQRPSETSMPMALDSRRGILKRSIVCGGMNSTELVLGKEAPAGRKSRFDLNRISPEQVERNNNLVIIESDASSEETISDDGRV